MKRRVHLIISGRVQGVYYRATTREKAKGLEIRGWVRNLPTGEVEVVAEGVEKNLKNFIQWCRKGPPGAIVRDIKEEWEDATGEFNSFEIRY